MFGANDPDLIAAAAPSPPAHGQASAAPAAAIRAATASVSAGAVPLVRPYAWAGFGGPKKDWPPQKDALVRHLQTVRPGRAPRKHLTINVVDSVQRRFSMAAAEIEPELDCFVVRQRVPTGHSDLPTQDQGRPIHWWLGMNDSTLIVLGSIHVDLSAARNDGRVYEVTRLEVAQT